VLNRLAGRRFSYSTKATRLTWDVQVSALLGMRYSVVTCCHSSFDSSFPCPILSLSVLYHTPIHLSPPVTTTYCIQDVGIPTSISLSITATATRWFIIFHVNQRLSTRRTIRTRSHFGTARDQEGWNTRHGSGWRFQQREVGEGIRIRSTSYNRLYGIHT